MKKKVFFLICLTALLLSICLNTDKKGLFEITNSNIEALSQIEILIGFYAEDRPETIYWVFLMCDEDDPRSKCEYHLAIGKKGGIDFTFEEQGESHFLELFNRNDIPENDYLNWSLV